MRALGVGCLLLAFAGPGAAAARPAPDRTLTVTYYMTNVRCPSCLRIEAWTRSAVGNGFPREIQAGRVVFAMVNLDEPGNEHFGDDYRLVTKSVIVSERSGGRELRWKNLDQVWRLQRTTPEAFVTYVRDEIRAWLKRG